MIERYTSDNFDDLLQVWEAAVRSTHDFLSEEDIVFYRSQGNSYLSQVELYVIRNKYGEIVAFMGLSEEVIELLFIHPDAQEKGYGSMLIDFAIQKKRYKVDVNEQNKKAYRFYINRGFKVVSRDEYDSSGKPFPILHLCLS